MNPMKEKSFMKQFWKTSTIEIAILIVLSLAKAVPSWAEPTSARAPQRRAPTFAPTPASELSDVPRSRPMFIVGGGTETIVGSDTRILLRAQFDGVDVSGQPYRRDTILAVSAEVGLSPGASGADALSRVKINFTPYERELADMVPGNGNVRILVAPTIFERDTSIGIKERLQISLIGLYFNFPLKEEENTLNGILYGILDVYMQAAGYTFTHTESSDHFVHALDMSVNAGFGAQLSRGWSVELVGNVRGSMGAHVAGNADTQPGTLFEGSGEIRVIFEDEPAFTRFRGFARVQYRALEIYSGDTGEIRDALSFIAGLEVGF